MAYVSAGDAPEYEAAHLIPVGIEGKGAVWDDENSVELKVGQRVYINKPIAVEKGMIFVIVTDRPKATHPPRKE
jgi:hypothetical protein